MSTPNTPEPLDPSFLITLPSFEGPLDLLLHLIRKHELDILDLPIAFVTERYLEYVTMMEQLDLDIASEYLVMAATLAHIKSKMLLPQEPEDQAEDETPEEELDPRAELIRRLLEYQKYKDAAEKLGARGIAGRDVFPRGSDAPQASGPPALAPTSLFKLLDAFQAVLKRAKADLAFEITAEGISIQDRMGQLTELLRERREITFEMLFEGQVTIYDLVITFMAILEMAKRRLVRIYQADPHSPIHLRSTVVGEEGEEGGAADPFEPAGEPEASADPAPPPMSEPREEAEANQERDPDPGSLELDFDEELDDIEELASLYDLEGEEALEPASDAAVEGTHQDQDAVDELAGDAPPVSDATPDAEPQRPLDAGVEHESAPDATDAAPEPPIELAEEGPGAAEPTLEPHADVSFRPNDEPEPLDPADPLVGERALDELETVTDPVFEPAFAEADPAGPDDLQSAGAVPVSEPAEEGSTSAPDARVPREDTDGRDEPRTAADPEPDDGLQEQLEAAANLDEPAEPVRVQPETPVEAVAEPEPPDGALGERTTFGVASEPAFEAAPAEPGPEHAFEDADPRPVAELEPPDDAHVEATSFGVESEPVLESATPEPADGLDEPERTAFAEETPVEAVAEPEPPDGARVEPTFGATAEPDPADGLDEPEPTALAEEPAGDAVARPEPPDGALGERTTFGVASEPAFEAAPAEPGPEHAFEDADPRPVAELEPPDDAYVEATSFGVESEPVLESATPEPADGLDEPERTAFAEEAPVETAAELELPDDAHVEPTTFGFASEPVLESATAEPEPTALAEEAVAKAEPAGALVEPVASAPSFESATAELEPTALAEEPAGEAVARPEPPDGALGERTTFGVASEPAFEATAELEPTTRTEEAPVDAVAEPEPAAGALVDRTSVEVATESATAELEPTVLAEAAPVEAVVEPEIGEQDPHVEPDAGMGGPVELERVDAFASPGGEPGRDDERDGLVEPAVAEAEPVDAPDEPERPALAEEAAVAEPETGIGEEGLLAEPAQRMRGPVDPVASERLGFESTAGQAERDDEGDGLVEPAVAEPEQVGGLAGEVAEGRAATAEPVDWLEAAGSERIVSEPAYGLDAPERAALGEAEEAVAEPELETGNGARNPSEAMLDDGSAEPEMTVPEARHAHDGLLEGGAAPADAPPPLEDEEETPRQPGAAESEAHTAQTDAAASDEDEDA